MRLVPLAACIAPCVLLLTIAAEAAPRVNCATALSTYEMNICADRDYKSADARLNRVYRDAIAQTRNRDSDAPYAGKAWAGTLKSSQRDWIKHRDSDCKRLVPQEWSGGTGTTAAVLNCLTDKTIVRTNELKNRYGS